MDLFKAIFGDSSSSESSDSEVDQGDTLPTPTDAVVVPPLPEAASVTEPSLLTASAAMGNGVVLCLFYSKQSQAGANLGVCAEMLFLLL